tara:strand:- start:1214 stop:1402 length:189 start_codon:yes stop_codon:yes gene_type:complete
MNIDKENAESEYLSTEDIYPTELKEKAKSILTLLSNKTVAECKTILYLLDKYINESSVLKVQ